MTPVGHLSISYILGNFLENKFGKAVLIAFLIGGTLPDIDFLFLPFKLFNMIHRKLTHNLFFIVIISLIGFLVTNKQHRKIMASVLFLSGFLHLLIDSCMDSNPSNGIGIAFLWPFSDKYFSPFNVLQPDTNDSGWDEPLKMFNNVIKNFIYELPFWGLMLFDIVYHFHKRYSKGVPNG